MEAIHELAVTSLKWEQPSAWRFAYVLRAGDAETATLQFRSAWQSFATAEIGDACWTFERDGFFPSPVSIRTCGDAVEIATFRNNTWSWGGTLEFPDGRVLRATTNLWGTRMEWQRVDEVALVRFHTGGVVRQSAQVEVEAGGGALAELPLLIVLGWYLIVMMSQDSNVVSGFGA